MIAYCVSDTQYRTNSSSNILKWQRWQLQNELLMKSNVFKEKKSIDFYNKNGFRLWQIITQSGSYNLFPISDQNVFFLLCLWLSFTKIICLSSFSHIFMYEKPRVRKMFQIFSSPGGITLHENWGYMKKKCIWKACVFTDGKEIKRLKRSTWQNLFSPILKP